MRKFFTATLIILAIGANAQDPRFSQFHLMPQYLNPAMTGFFDGDVRFAAIFRDQWFSLGSPYGATKYETFGGEVDGCIKVGKPAEYERKQDYIGIGGAVIRDVAGDQAFTSTDGFFNIAYSKSFGYKVKHSIALGLQAELISNQFRNGGAVFPDGIVENIGKSNIKFDGTVGLRYHVDFQKRLNMYFGFAYSHIASPTFNFLDVSSDKLYAKYVAHAGAVIAIRDKVNLVPSFMFLKQGPAIEANVGASAQYIIGNVYDSKKTISFGIMARFARPEGPEAIIPNVRLEMYHFTLGVAYDINVSNLSRGTNSVGAIEVAAVYIYKHKKHMIPTNASCPQW